MNRDRLAQARRLPAVWTATIVTISAVAALAITGLGGHSPIVAGAAILGVGGVAVVLLVAVGPVVSDRVRGTIGRGLLGLVALSIAGLGTLMGIAEGFSEHSVLYLVILTALWLLSATLLLAGLLYFLRLPHLRRQVAAVGRALSIGWGLVVAVILTGIAADLLSGGGDGTLIGSLWDDLGTFLVVFVTLVVLPALAFRQDLRNSG